MDIADDDYDENNDNMEDRDVSDDTSYDDEAKEDTAESLCSLTAEQRKIAEYELLADAAALGGVDLVQPINPFTSAPSRKISEQSKARGRGSGKGRSATMGLKCSEPMYLEFDKVNRSIGKWERNYGKHIGFSMRKLNINWNWKDVSEGKKKLLWEDTMVNILALF
ncbi:hypothetical protein RND81_11G096900 [Saponaria officinalis]|uniref:Uncharacterized protein n=1 Tax=Saponaria officinalis TaxID=3572 RepID=A0AAW1HLR8_SAPOF